MNPSGGMPGLYRADLVGILCLRFGIEVIIPDNTLVGNLFLYKLFPTYGHGYPRYQIFKRIGSVEKRPDHV